MTSAQPTYELIFQGIKPTGGKSIQHLKAALIGELEYSVDEVRKILACKQAVLKRSNDQSDLSHMQGVLEKAGAMVSLQKVDEDSLIISEAEDQNQLTESILLDETLVAKKGEPEMLDPLEQISDLFRDLEEVCVTGVGETVLKELRDSNRERQTNEDTIIQPVPRTRPAMLKKKFWYRIVSLPEMIFSIGFSLILALCSALFYHL